MGVRMCVCVCVCMRVCVYMHEARFIIILKMIKYSVVKAFLLYPSFLLHSLLLVHQREMNQLEAHLHPRPYH